MRKSWRLAPLALSLLLVMQSSALAWDEAGHMLVSAIAYERLNPVAKAKVDALSKTIRFCGRTYDGTNLGAWMDDIRADSTHDDLRVWHYVDIPVFDGVPPDPKLQPDKENAVARLNWAVESLRKGTGADKKDAELLGYVFHLVGDLHQPLHAATRVTAAHKEGDAGGNQFKLANVPEVDNLHAYWDAAAGAFNFWRPDRPLNNFERRRFDAYARQLVAAYPADSLPEAKVLDPQKWAEESNQLAREVAYALPENSQPSAAYEAKAQDVARRRIALAGYRLANLLNSIYPEVKTGG
ncbi:MAG: S1/P1 nuclease [Acidobacteria bacterium]|nr:S1/P1 nuclease [Acidobacteriota bacterium]